MNIPESQHALMLLLAKGWFGYTKPTLGAHFSQELCCQVSSATLIPLHLAIQELDYFSALLHI
jgi:hypothetical protein